MARDERKAADAVFETAGDVHAALWLRWRAGATAHREEAARRTFMVDIAVVFGCLVFVAAALALESRSLRRARRAVPLRIVVMGTRGKSSVTRLIAAGLRAGGLRVVHKTTGSEAVIGSPDGEEFTVRRYSTPTPLEQRGVLRRAVRWRAEALVIEAMSIRPESLFAELRRIVVPTLVVITNVRADHVADLPDPVDVFARAVPPGALVLYPVSAADGLSGALSARGVRSESLASLPDADWVGRLPYVEWPENVTLAMTACGCAGIDADVALQGMAHVRPDVGALAAWRIHEQETEWVAVNAFAANDPESTTAALHRSLETWGRPGQRRIGLLNLRRDRGDRTAQWVSLLKREHGLFDRLVLAGDVPLVSAHALRRSYGDALRVVTSRDATRVMAQLGDIEPEGGLVFGFGNIGGLGMRLVARWEREGERV